MAAIRLPDIASEAVFDLLSSITAVTNVVGDRIVNQPFLPMDMATPACMHYAEPGGNGYGSAINPGNLPNTVGLRYVVKFLAAMQSTDEIDEAANAVLQQMAGYIPARAGYAVVAESLEPWPQSLGTGTLVEGGDVYKVSGDFYRIEVFKQGA